jgi:hypothetical protein
MFLLKLRTISVVKFKYAGPEVCEPFLTLKSGSNSIINSVKQEK